MKKLNPAKIKERIMKIGLKTGCSHVASALSCVNVLCDTYNAFPDEIIILSKGHGALALYVILNELGKLPNKVLDTYYQDGGLGIHSTLAPEYGIYASTGSLGHGLGIGVGYAIANPKRKVFVIMSDGELDCGSTWEALRLMLKLNLTNLLPVVDVNGWHAFSKFDEKSLDFMYRNYYSTKGEGWGKFENTVDAHYQIVTPELYKEWKKNFPTIEKKRLQNIEEYKSKLKGVLK